MTDRPDIDDPDRLRLADPRRQGMAIVPVVLARYDRLVLTRRCQVNGEAAGRQYQDHAHASEPRNR